MILAKVAKKNAAVFDLLQKTAAHYFEIIL
jgi:hypothetical protein